jgi:lysophospholipase L1-like esterase
MTRRGLRGLRRATRAPGRIGRGLVLAVAAVFLPFGASCEKGPASGNASRMASSIAFVGRFEIGDAGPPTAEWSASAMRARFSGTSVGVELSGAGHFFDVVIDGTPEPTLATTSAGIYPIAGNLAQGAHDILVFRRDEADEGPTQFIGFDYGAGTPLAAPTAPVRKIEIVGDSISAGFGDECANAQDTFTSATENEYIAYGPLAARSLAADVHVVAWSGKGMYRNLDGTTTETMPVLWQRTIPTIETSRWDPSQWVPDAVVINLGTNDFNASGSDPTASFQATYLQFVTVLRGAYPGAFLFCSVGPMLGGTKYSEAKTAIANTISARNAAGDARLHLVEFPTQDCGADGSGCGCAGHPNAAEHQKMATVLVTSIRTALGW